MGSPVKWFVSNPSKAILLVAVLVVASILSVYAYFSSLAPRGGPRVAITSPPIEFSMELDKTAYAYGENITMTFCLKNISNQTITVAKSSLDFPLGVVSTETIGVNEPRLSAFQFGFSVADDNGTVIYERYRGPFQTAYEFTVEPNGYLRQTFLWRHPDFLASPLPRGAYQIRGIFYGSVVPGFGIPSFVTSPITFTVE